MADTIYIPDLGRKIMLRMLCKPDHSGLDGNATFHLFQTPITLARSLTVADMTELAMDGYADLVLAGGLPPAIDSNGAATSIWPQWTVTAGGGLASPVTSYGVYATGGADDELLWLQVFDEPLTWNAPGDFFVFDPRFSLGEENVETVAPIVMSLAPNFGPTAGDTEVKIHGADFTGAEAVLFDADEADFVINSDIQITAYSPPHATGIVDVTVISAEGTSPIVSGDMFSYGDASIPVAGVGLASAVAMVASGESTSGIGAGQASATVLASSLVLADGNALAVGVASVASNLSAGAGAGAAIATAIITGQLAAAAGAGAATATLLASSLATGAAHAAAAGVSTVTHNLAVGSAHAAAAGVSTVTHNLAAGTGAGSAAGVPRVATNLRAGSGSAAAAGVPRVTANSGAGAGTGSAAATLAAVPYITSMTPLFAFEVGGTTVSLTGTNFTGATAVKFTATNATSFVVNSSTSITCVSPALSAGGHFVTVVNATGTSPNSAGTQITCAYLEDHFIDTNGVLISAHAMELGAGYTVFMLAGSASNFVITTNSAVINTSSSTYAQTSASATAANKSVQMTFIIANAGGGRVELFCRFQDSSNYFVLECDWKAKTLTIYSIIATVKTSLGAITIPTLAVSTTYTLNFIPAATNVRGNVQGGTIGVNSVGPFTNSSLATQTGYGFGIKRDDTNNWFAVNVKSFVVF
jgi:hypothetical protein